MLEKERTEKALDEVFRWWSGETMSLRDYLNIHKVKEKTIERRTHERRRKQLEYRELATPKLEYYLTTVDEHHIEVQKLVFDSFNVPEFKSGHWQD